MTCRGFVAGVGRRLDAALPPRTAARADRRLCRGISRAAESDARAALAERLVRALVHAALAPAA